jgi:hypothetical protein
MKVFHLHPNKQRLVAHHRWVPDKGLSEPERAELERLHKEIATLKMGVISQNYADVRVMSMLR